MIKRWEGINVFEINVQENISIDWHAKSSKTKFFSEILNCFFVSARKLRLLSAKKKALISAWLIIYQNNFIIKFKIIISYNLNQTQLRWLKVKSKIKNLHHVFKKHIIQYFQHKSRYKQILTITTNCKR